jgi:hypothetical protein
VALFLALAAVGSGAMLLKARNDRLLQAAGQALPGGLLQAPGQGTAGGLVQAPGEAKGGGLVQAPGQAPSGKAIQAPGENPADVDDYLKFLKRIEASKQRLIRAQLGDALAMLPMAQMMRAEIEESRLNQSIESFDKKFSRMAEDWNALTGEFQKRVPPESCRDLHSKYYVQLSKMQQYVLETQESLNMALKSITESMQGSGGGGIPQDQLSKLSDLKGKAGPEMDEAIRKADDSLADVCDRYKLRKEFDIRGDSSSTGALLR